MDESYTFERVDNGWLVKFKNPQSSHYTEVFQDSDLYEDEDMTATESLHDALRSAFSQYLFDTSQEGLSITLVEHDMLEIPEEAPVDEAL
tara:strand:+ start:893 stop:1162 length:270 start_codon:yes stop_codon:yes gene_type:complete